MSARSGVATVVWINCVAYWRVLACIVGVGMKEMLAFYTSGTTL